MLTTMSAMVQTSRTATATHAKALSRVRALFVWSAVAFTGFAAPAQQAAYSTSANSQFVAENLPELAIGNATQLFDPASSFHLTASSLATSARPAELFTGAPAPSASPNGLIRGGGAIPTRRIGPFSTFAIEAYAGFTGVGLDVATPLARHFNLRVGGGFFHYADTFTEQGANVDANLQLRSGRALLDWFPFRGGFHISPMLVFANNNKVRGTVIVPSGTSITLDGSNYVSSTTDPLHGSASVDFRKTAPGLTFGFGNLIPRSGKHLSFPTEIGFYYVGQPTLKVAFTGSACDPTVPASIGCESVDTDSGFQQSLRAFTARNNNNLSYASFFPMISSGVGFRF